MSKSLGNVIDPNEVIKTHGAEILRLWVASVEFGEDVTISPDMLARLSEAYRKLRNTFRYCLSNLYDFDPQKDSVKGSELEELDAWALERTADLLERVQAAYGEYAFHKVYRAIYDFATVDLSAFYFDILKDRLYTAPARSVRRRSAQTAICYIAEALVRAVGPLLPFTAEEVWTNLPGLQGREKSVHLTRYLRPEELRAQVPPEHSERLEKWPRLIEVRNAVLKALEVARQEKFIGGSLEAQICLAAEGDVKGLLEEYEKALPTIFIVSQVELCSSPVADALETEIPGLKIKIEKALGNKCERCWNYSEQVGKDSRYPTVCERCSEALREIESSGQ
jgi:isoleucyl-tRNA synthetase